MRPAIAAFAIVAALLLVGVDRLFPVWPVHVLVILALIVVATLAGLAMVASHRRGG